MWGKGRVKWRTRGGKTRSSRCVCVSRELDNVIKEEKRTQRILYFLPFRVFHKLVELCAQCRHGESISNPFQFHLCMSVSFLCLYLKEQICHFKFIRSIDLENEIISNIFWILQHRIYQ